MPTPTINLQIASIHQLDNSQFRDKPLWLGTAIANFGTDISGPFTVEVFLSRDDQLDSSDAMVWTFRTTIPSKEAPYFNAADNGITVPGWIRSGKYYPIVKIDTRLEVSEQNENDNVTVSNSNSTTIGGGLPTAKDIFAGRGEMAFSAEMSLAAYKLGGQEVLGKGINNIKAGALAAYQSVGNSVKLLTDTDLPSLAVSQSGTRFGAEGLRDGIYTNANAAALVSRSKDAIFIAFRGTNDNDDDPLFRSPDEEDWIGKRDHFVRYADLFDALRSYVGKAENGIQKAYVTGHSLGAAMVEAYMQEVIGVSTQAMTFANPAYGDLRPKPDERIVNLWLDGDPILSATKFTQVEGDKNRIYHNIEDKDVLHSMLLYAKFARFMHEHRIDRAQLFSDPLHGIDYDRIWINAQSAGKIADYKIGTGNDVITGSEVADILLGGDGSDELSGGKGRDHIDGGAQHDRLAGGKHADFLYGRAGDDRLSGGLGADFLSGGTGRDTFVFNDLADLGTTIDATDTIDDFRAQGQLDTIDVFGIDASTAQGGNQAFRWIGTTGFSGEGRELRYSSSANQTVIRGDIDGDGAADFFIVLRGSHALLASDFVL